MAGASFRQDKAQPLNQAIVEKVHFQPERCGGFYADSEEHASVACLSERGEEQLTGRQKEVQGIDSSQRAHPEVFKVEHLLFAAEVFLDSPTGKIIPHKGCVSKLIDAASNSIFIVSKLTAGGECRRFRRPKLRKTLTG